MLKSDFHLHTVMSGHAFCTVTECVAEASKKGIDIIGITDHGPSMKHSAHEGYFEMAKRLPKNINNVVVLFGCEANVIDIDGTLDISKKTQSLLDIVMVGLHERTPYRGFSEKDNTNALVSAISKNAIHIVSHPFRPNFPVNVKALAETAISNHVLLEINKHIVLNAISAHDSNKISKETITKTAEMVRVLQSHNIGYIINSDAHYSDEIGISDNDIILMEQYLGVKREYIYNNNIPVLKEYFNTEDVFL
jgi:putative hydrolase